MRRTHIVMAMLRSAVPLVVVLAACDSDGGTGPVPGPAPVAAESPHVIELSPSGMARALRSGYGQVTATVEGRSAAVGLTVMAPEAAGEQG